MIKQKVGARVRELRNQKGLSQENLHLQLILTGLI